MSIIVVAPATMRALIALYSLSASDLERRPGTALANLLLTSRQVAERHIATLVREGLVAKRVRGIGLVVPLNGSVFHAHAPGRPCTRAGLRVEGLPGDNARLVLDPLVGWVIARKADTECCEINYQLETGRRAFAELASVMRNSADKIAAMLQKKVVVYADDRRGARKKATPKVDGTESLADGYTMRRRRFNVEFEPTRALEAEMSKAAAALTSAGIGRDRWGDYLDFLFEQFPIVTREKCAFPPPRICSSQFFIDSFAAQMPAKKIDAKRVRELLGARGYTGPIDPVITIARRIREGESMPKGLRPDVAEAVNWLVENIHEVGTVEVR